MTEIKKNLFQVTHLFDEPIRELELQNDYKNKSKKQSYENSEKTLKTISRVSTLRPESFLKN